MRSDRTHILSIWHIAIAFAVALLSGILFYIISLIIDQLLSVDIPNQIFSATGSTISTLCATLYLSNKLPIKYSISHIKTNLKKIIIWGVCSGILISIIQFPYSTIIGKKTISAKLFIPITAGMEYVAILLILAIIITPVVEEFFFRACVYNILKNRYSVKVAYITTAFLFSIMHPASLIQSILFFFSSILLTYIYEKTGLIETSILAHLIWNATWFVSIYAYHMSLA
jgi:membrane protease YdiL (CAAX protease family)